ncbi:MAG: DUF4240 domain-containing protein [Kineosporiaceae bacterium]
MDEDTFWGLIESARTEVGDSVERADDIAETLVSRLAGLSVEELVGFDTHVFRLLVESYRWDLWGAAYLINGGCSDDGFDYFRGWLIAQGREAWDAALDDPDSLADVLRVEAPGGEPHGRGADGLECEEMLGVAAEAYERLTGGEEGFEDALDLATEGIALPAEPAGEEWDFDDADELADRFPRLARMFLDTGSGDEDDPGEDDEG